MYILRIVTFFILLCTDVTMVFSHSDPPIMKFTMEPDIPAKNEIVHIRMFLVGANTGIPTLGAKIKIVVHNSRNGKVIIYPIAQGDKAGEYKGVLTFPQPGLWKMKIEITHLNEFDAREYPVQVADSPPEYRSAMTDETRLFLHTNPVGQPVPPLVLLGSVVVFILLLLVAIVCIKRLQVQERQ